MPAIDFVFKLFSLDMVQLGGENSSTVGKSMECRRVRFSTLGGSIKDLPFLFSNKKDKNFQPEESTRSDSYQALYDRAKSYFTPCHPHKGLRLLYQDEDDDWIVIGSNEELIAATMDVLNKTNRSSLAIGVHVINERHHNILPDGRSRDSSDGSEPIKISTLSSNGYTGWVDHFRSTNLYHIRKCNLLQRVYLVAASGIAMVCAAALCIPIGTYVIQRHGGDSRVQVPLLNDSHVDPISTSGLLSTADMPSQLETTRSRPVSGNSHSFSCDPTRSACATQSPLGSIDDMFSNILDETDPSTSQHLQKALDWMRKDPHWHRYPKDRLRQRLGLAAFYYATNGDQSWKRSDDWMSYEVSECHWWPGSYTMSICGSQENHHYQENDWEYERLWLPGNGLEGTLPLEMYGLLPSLRTIRLDRNIWLSGTLPSEIGGLSQLQQLWLHHNMLAGSLPSEISRLTQLEKLSLAGNSFTGSIASGTFGKLTSLRKLWLDHNAFTGRVPADIGDLPLVKLHLSHNHFDGGGLPAFLLASLTNLEQLVTSISSSTAVFSWEEQDPVIPTEIGLMTKLRHLDLYVLESTWSSLSLHKWQRSEVASMHTLDSLRIASETSGETLVDLATL